MADPVSMLQRAFANGWVKDPAATTFQTQLPSQLEQLFQKAAQSRFGGKVDFQPDLSPTSDYDYRGWWQAYKKNDPRAATGINPNDKQLHFPDVWKTPYHHSFSQQSQYASPTAPQWTEQQPYRLVAQQHSPAGTYHQGDVVFDEGPYSQNVFPPEVAAALKLGWPEAVTGQVMPAPVGQSVLSPPSASVPAASQAPGFFSVPHALGLAALLHALSQVHQ